MGLHDGFPPNDHKKGFEISLDVATYFGEQEEFFSQTTSINQRK